MRVACVLLPHFPFQVERLNAPDLVGRAVVIVDPRGKKRTVLDVSPALKDVRPGTPLMEVLSRHPTTLQREADFAL